MGFTEPVSHKEVLDELKKRLERKLRKTRLISDLDPDLESGTDTYKTSIELVERLAEADVELYVVNTDGLKKTHFSHPVARQYEKAYALCDKIRPTLWFKSYDGANYADTGIRVFGGKLMVYLGERKPFIPWQGEVFETTVGELRKLAVTEMNPYAERLAEHGIKFELIRLPPEDSLKAVFADEHLSIDEYQHPAHVHYISDYHYLHFQLTEQERLEKKMRAEELRRREREANERLKAILSECELVSPATAPAKLYRVKPETVVKISKEAAETASEAYLLLCGSDPDMKGHITANMPISIIQTYNLLERLDAKPIKILPPPSSWSDFNEHVLKGLKDILKGYHIAIRVGHLIEGEERHFSYLYLLFRPRRKPPIANPDIHVSNPLHEAEKAVNPNQG